VGAAEDTGVDKDEAMNEEGSNTDSAADVATEALAPGEELLQEEGDNEQDKEVEPVATQGLQEGQEEQLDAGPGGPQGMAAGADMLDDTAGAQATGASTAAEQCGGDVAQTRPDAGAPGESSNRGGGRGGGSQMPSQPLTQDAEPEASRVDDAAPDDSTVDGAPGAHRPASQQTNPFRSLGDAREQWRRDLLVGCDAAEEDGGAAGGEEGGPKEGPEYQFLRQEGEQVVAKWQQALADATQAQIDEQAAAAADGAGLEDEGAPQEEEALTAAEEAAEGNAPATEAGEGEGTAGGGGPSRGANQVPPAAPEPPASLGGGTAQMDLDDLHATTATSPIDRSNTAHLTASSTIAATEELFSGLERLLQANVDTPKPLDESAVTTGAESNPAAQARGQELFARCTALTGSLTAELVEQMRLVLEPTTASRMCGDYKTGKRLNMKKVIGYIASNFRQDKIWQRRTRLDKRQYQVVMAIDETRSMRVRDPLSLPPELAGNHM
jgi:midasin